MRYIDILRLALDNLSRRKGRTALTVIGVVVGTCAIVVMISLGLAMSQSIETMLQSWGDLTQIQIYNYSYGPSETPMLDDEMLSQIRAVEHVQAVTPQYSPNNLSLQIYAGRNDRYQYDGWGTYGMYPDALEPMGFRLRSGDFLEDGKDYGTGKIPVLVGGSYAYSFADTTKGWNSSKRTVYEGQVDAMGNPVPPFVNLDTDKLTLRLSAVDANGKEVTKDYQLVIAGVFEPDMAKGYFTQQGMVFRLNDLKRLEQEYKKMSGKRNSGGGSYMIDSTGHSYAMRDNGYEEVYIKVDKVDNVEDVESYVKGLGYETYSMVQIREEMQGQVQQTQFILGGLAAISLFVAALNIANTMTMAIYERTREIGVMKVLGCELGKIRSLFLVEAGGIGFLGGAIGVALSLFISFIMNNIQTILGALNGGGLDIGQMFGIYGGGGDKISVIPLWLILFALLFSTIIGLLSGVMPAIRATRISALEAIRHE